MKQCPTCELTWSDDNLFCLADSSLLVDGPDEPEVETAEPAPEAPARNGLRVIEGGNSLAAEAVGALESRRAAVRDAIRARMKQIDRYNTTSRAVRRFVETLEAESDRFSHDVDSAQNEDGMRQVYSLTIGEGPWARSFPIRVTYSRDSSDVALEIGLEGIGSTREERAMRAGVIGGESRGGRYGLRAPASLDGEAAITGWLEDEFRSVFRLAYSQAA